MKHMHLKLLIILTAVWVPVNSIADEAEIENVKNSIQSVLSDMEIDLIEESLIPGMYSVLIGAEVFYVSADGQYLLRGDLIDIPNKLNISEEKRTVARRNMLQQVPEKDLINFGPDNPDYTVYVFTDVTCPYCQRLQGDIKEINDKGITVKYLAFPRQGVGTPASDMMEKIWCAENRQEAFLDMMIGLEVEDINCDSPVVEQFSLGQAMG
ncbi:MAG: DsbC family protein, partial [Gammaproteobacteria bacterium]|nr:DsbC family protein [Gammaproteobacteria bacterium]